MKKEYVSPELKLVLITMQDVIMGSGPENHNSYIDDSDDDWGDYDE